MKKSKLIALLDKLEIQPSRKLGQNFLIDGNTLRLIVDQAAPAPGQRVLEIGPGPGILTHPLVEAGATVDAIEIDSRLAEYLREQLGNHPRFTLHHADACRVDLAAIVGDLPYVCIANLPYAISTVAIGRMLALPNRPTRLTILLQREMAERLVAKPRTKAYGSLSVRTQTVYRIKIVRIVPPTVFLPPPEVDSALVTMDILPDAPDVATYDRIDTIVRQAFSQRRKQLKKLLKPIIDPSLIPGIFEELGITLEARAEELTPEQFIALAHAIPVQD